MLNITLVPILNDNYAYILESGNQVAVIDPGEADPVITKLQNMNLKPDYILNTHHHGDHIAGNKKIKEKYGCIILGPEKDKSRIDDLDKGLNEGDNITFGNETFTVMETPGHTSGHICFFFPESKVLFSGDTLFAMGCGRTFEGTPEQLFDAFSRFKSLPDETKIYCGHEYTLDNARFCLSIEPDNEDLKQRYTQTEKLRANNQPTIPFTLGEEKKTSIFMRAYDAEEFKRYRKLKDNF
jgi:hydroxyacylglutathione hydrolase